MASSLFMLMKQTSEQEDDRCKRLRSKHVEAYQDRDPRLLGTDD